MMTGDNEVLVRTTRTTPLRDLDTLARRIDDVRRATVKAGRREGDVEIVIAGAWPMLDVRLMGASDQYLEVVAKLEAIGVDWTISICCGDDSVAAQETVERFGEEVIRAAKDELP
jgi:hypothetical protein